MGVPALWGFRADDLDHIPGLPAHTELIDGSLVFVRPQASFHVGPSTFLRLRYDAVFLRDCTYGGR